MALSIPAASPSSSPSPQSPQSSADGSNGPSTPVSPSQVQTLSLPPPAEPINPAQTDASATSTNNNTASGPPHKRKPSRRANTAERRATHNAVERARRETLNGRFLDLAALLPNLSQIRRPSKSSIVNSSIAHIHASRRHRLLAARELRLLKLESDALRRELNEWRDRAGLPRIDEPVRGEGFQMIMSGEVEILGAGIVEEEAGEDEYGDEDGPAAYHAPMTEDPPFAHSVHHQLSPHHPHPHQQQQNAHGLHLQTMLPRNGIPSPMVVQSPQAVSFENPAMMYDPPHLGQYFSSVNVNESPNAKWSGGVPYGGQQQFTPPQSSHGYGGAVYGGHGQRGYPQQQQTLARYGGGGQQQQQQQQQDNDDASSVGSGSPAGMGGVGMVGGKRERSSSVGSDGRDVLVGGGGMGRRPLSQHQHQQSVSPHQQQQWTGAEDGQGYGLMGVGVGVGGMGVGGGMGGMGGRGASGALAVGGGNAFGGMML